MYYSFSEILLRILVVLLILVLIAAVVWGVIMLSDKVEVRIISCEKLGTETNLSAQAQANYHLANGNYGVSNMYRAFGAKTKYLVTVEYNGEVFTFESSRQYEVGAMVKIPACNLEN